MGSYMDFLNNGETPQNEGAGSKSAVGRPLVSQSSVYSLTFQEFQNNLGGSGKDFGSMNMDELLKNIWMAEDTQAMATSAFVEQGSSSAPNGNLQRQGSLSLPRILSQKTVEEVWKELFSENGEVKDVNPNDRMNSPQQNRQPTFGEVTLEEFLSRAGVVREDAQQMASSDGNYCGGSSQANNNTGLTIGFQPSTRNNLIMGNRILGDSKVGPNQPSSLPMNMTGITPSQQPQPLFPKQATVTFTSSRPMTNNAQLASSGTRGPMTRIADHVMNHGLYQGGPLGMGASFSGEKMGGAMSSANQLSPDMTTKSNGDTSSVSPPSYMLGGVSVGRKSGTMEKAMERRQRRMIKNRESASRSRARKQAYTFELEAEVAKLKDMNGELRKKQDEIMELQHNQALEKTKNPSVSKRRCLRRTLTPPW